MSIDLKQLFEVIGESYSIDCKLDFSEYELFNNKPFFKPVIVTGKIENKAGIVFLKMDVCFSIKVECDRCLDEFERDFSYSFEHILVAELNTDNDEYVVLQNHVLDLDDLVMADILLNLPSKLLCNEDCKGLCNQCGQNFNHGSCECNDSLVDPRLAVLGELLK